MTPTVGEKGVALIVGKKTSLIPLLCTHLLEPQITILFYMTAVSGFKATIDFYMAALTVFLLLDAYNLKAIFANVGRKRVICLTILYGTISKLQYIID